MSNATVTQVNRNVAKDLNTDFGTAKAIVDAIIATEGIESWFQHGNFRVSLSDSQRILVAARAAN